MPEQQTQSRTLTTVFSDVLQNLAFMFTDETPPEASPGDIWLETTIGYQGPVSGLLRLWCPSSFSRSLAANLLGIDTPESASDQESEDAVKEFMNVVCGQYVTTAHGSGPVFKLTIPQVTQMLESPDLHRIGGTAHVCFSVDGMPVALAYEQDAQTAVVPT